jgi:hypothetical protein
MASASASASASSRTKRLFARIIPDVRLTGAASRAASNRARKSTENAPSTCTTPGGGAPRALVEHEGEVDDVIVWRAGPADSQSSQLPSRADASTRVRSSARGTTRERDVVDRVVGARVVGGALRDGKTRERVRARAPTLEWDDGNDDDARGARCAPGATRDARRGRG